MGLICDENIAPTYTALLMGKKIKMLSSMKVGDFHSFEGRRGWNTQRTAKQQLYYIPDHSYTTLTLHNVCF
jgi:hypothetical protein